ncbi:hypothetical protein FEI14_03090 [Lacticaseibacillus zeae]|uniref:Uncharacterized protein n=1 Tax=Lacticaseibacillus zeae TaxID=57037 RepID=A0A5R8M5A7_LACZE|nr:hypothetical protein FEI14_03090 [Lacticaseibacillus zeae]
MSADVSLSLRLAITRSPAQKPPHKDLKPKWPKTSHLSLRPLPRRFTLTNKKGQRLRAGRSKFI